MLSGWDRQGDMKVPGTLEAWDVSSGWKDVGKTLENKSATGWEFCTMGKLGW